MKYLKRIIVILIMALTVILPGELYQGYLDQFNDFAYVSFYCPEDVLFSQMLDDITETAQKHDVLVFKIKSQTKSLFLKDIKIYSDNKSKAYLNNEYNIYDGSFSSLFSGSTNIEFLDFSNISSELVSNDPEFQLVGNMKNLKEFKSELINQYAGSFPKHSGYDGRKDTKFYIIGIWIAFIIISSFFTLYETLRMKKENFIRITLGESLFSIWLKYTIFDVLFLCGAFGIFILLAYSIYSIIFMSKYVLTMFLTLIVLNVIISTNLLIYDKNKVLANTFISGFLLKINKTVKCFTIILTVICISISLSLIYECKRFYDQKQFYDTYSNYCVLCNIKVNDSSADRDIYEGDFYKKYNEELNIFFLLDWVSFSDDESALCANHNTINYLQSCIPELKNCDFKSDVYVFYNENKGLTEEDIDWLRPYKDVSFSSYAYKEDAKIVAFGLDSDKEFTIWKENPVIIYYNKDYAEIYDVTELYSEIQLTNCIVKNDIKIEQFKEDNNISMSKTLMSEIFNQQWKKLSRTLYISSILVFMLIFMQIIVIYSIIKLEYSVNAIQLSVKKIIGYSMFQRFSFQYISTFVLYLISLIGAVLISTLAGFGNSAFMIYGTVVMYIADNVIFTIYANKYDKENVQRILKGGII